MKWMAASLSALAGTLALNAAPARAQESAACLKVRFADVGGSDIAATTGLASVVLQALGYQTSVTVASVPVTFAGLKGRPLGEPHPLNAQAKMKYLSGGGEVFGPNQGEAKVYTAIAPGYEARCPNVAAFLKNLHFSTAMENEVMLAILDKAKPEQAARDWLAKNPQAVEPWLKGVKTFKGEDGLAAVAKAIKGGGA